MQQDVLIHYKKANNELPGNIYGEKDFYGTDICVSSKGADEPII